ncbi:MAG: ABC transporter substrate-binding protein [Candidatus Binatia bacterium]
MKLFKVFMAVFGVLGLVVGAGPSAASAAPPKVREITIVQPSPFQPAYDIIQWLMANEAAKDGIKIKFPQAKGQTAQMAVLVRGDADIAYHTPGATVRAVKKGLAVAFAGWFRYSTFPFVVPAEIKTLQDLKGKRLGAHARGSLTEFTVRVILGERGIKAEDYELLYIPGTPKRAAALRAGQLSGTVISAVPAFRLERQTKGRLRIIGFLNELIPGAVSTTVWVTTPKVLKEKPELVKTFLNYYLRAVDRFHKEDVKELASFARSFWKKWKKYDVQDLESIFKRYRQWDMFHRDGRVAKDEWEKTMDLAVKYEAISPGERLSYEQVFDTAILKEVLSRR